MMQKFLVELRRRFEAADDTSKETLKIAADSWGAGYDLGYRDALGELLEYLENWDD